MKTRSFSRSIKRWLGENWRERLTESALSPKGRQRERSLRPAVELLEDRTLLSVLPPPLITGQTDLITQINDSAFLGTHNTPSISVDPTNSQRLVAVFTTNMTSVGAANPL